MSRSMHPEDAIEIGMEIAEKHLIAVADLIEVKPDITIGQALKGTLVWLGAEIMKALCADDDEKAPFKVMTVDEYVRTPIVGWHEVCRNVDGAGGIGIRYLAQPEDE